MYVNDKAKNENTITRLNEILWWLQGRASMRIDTSPFVDEHEFALLDAIHFLKNRKTS